jgi:8-oxo-dGTP diphosphatase
MKKYNLVLVYDENKEKVLMCKREKEPYKGMLNLVGGKIEKNETDIESAYRELKEETGIGKNDIELKPLMNFEYLVQNKEIKVFIGRLNKQIELVEEVNKLLWVNIEEDFYKLNEYAGEGNIWHMIHHANNYINI